MYSKTQPQYPNPSFPVYCIYIVTFIELVLIFYQFYPEIKIQFDVPIRTLHRNNSCELLSRQCQNFVASNDILHKTSCVRYLNNMG